MGELILIKSAGELRREIRQELAQQFLHCWKEHEKSQEFEKEQNKEIDEQMTEILESGDRTVLGPDDDWEKEIDRIESKEKYERETKIVSLPGKNYRK